MLTFLKVAVYLIGALFLVLGLAGMFTPEDFANGMGLSLASPEGGGTVRSMIGAHYVAMGAVCIFAMVRNQEMLLLPIAAIEVVMVVARGLSALNGEFVAATMVPTTIEFLASAILITAFLKKSQNDAA